MVLNGSGARSADEQAAAEEADRQAIAALTKLMKAASKEARFGMIDLLKFHLEWKAIIGHKRLGKIYTAIAQNLPTESDNPG